MNHADWPTQLLQKRGRDGLHIDRRFCDNPDGKHERWSSLRNGVSRLTRADAEPIPVVKGGSRRDYVALMAHTMLHVDRGSRGVMTGKGPWLLPRKTRVGVVGGDSHRNYDEQQEQPGVPIGLSQAKIAVMKPFSTRLSIVVHQPLSRSTHIHIMPPCKPIDLGNH